MAQRAIMGAANPSDVFIPILIATYFSTLTGLLAVAFWQKINLLNGVVLSWLLGVSAIIFGIIWYFSTLDASQIAKISTVAANLILLTIIVSFMLGAVRKKVNVYDAFIEGAKSGFETGVKVIPYLVAMLVGIAVFRASGAMGYIVDGIGWCIKALNFNTDFVGALPTAFMKPLSGSGAKAMMLETMKIEGADSFVGRLSCVFQGAADTTFYIVALYFGSVGIKKTRYAVAAGLIADLAGVIAAIFIAYLFFH
jgi:spore maturation protein SpmB